LKRLIKSASLQLDSPRKTEYTNKIRNEREDVTTDATEIQRIMRDYYEKLYTNKLDNLENMDEFLEIYNLTRLMEKEMATHSSVLAWRIPGMAEPGGLPSMGSVHTSLAGAVYISPFAHAHSFASTPPP